MAMQEKRGWTWTVQEKHWISTWKSDLETLSAHVAEQIEGFQELLPALAAEAAQAGGLFLDAAASLLSSVKWVKSKRYQRLSPEQVKTALAEVQQLYAEWMIFMTRPDVSRAISGANQQVRVHDLAQQMSKQSIVSRTYQAKAARAALESRLAPPKPSSAGLTNGAQQTI